TRPDQPAAQDTESKPAPTEPRQPGATPDQPSTRTTETKPAPGGTRQSGNTPGQPTAQATETKPAPGMTRQPGATPDQPAAQANEAKPMAGARRDVESRAPSRDGERSVDAPSRIPDPSEVPNAERLLRELAQRRSAAEQTAEEARSMREQAQRLLEKSTPAERERLRRWTELAQREGAGGPGAGDGPGSDSTMPPASSPRSLVDVDLTGQRPGDQVVAEWLSDEPAPTGGPATTSGARTERLEHARRAAERAVEDATVPSRYHRLVRRYFGRMDRAVPNGSQAGDGAAGTER
ncbi:MAG: hypothetical protein KDA22_15230, partial [Phycisphaerales bacterium]|nr:hypothetical protein [Phycisphaerales bacterium]